MILAIKHVPVRITSARLGSKPQASNAFALRDGVVVKKTHLAPHVHRAVVFEQRTALVGEIADGVVTVSATAPAPVGVEGARRVGKPV